MVAINNQLLAIGGDRSVTQEEDGRTSILGLQSAAIDQEGDYVCVVPGTDQKQVNHLTVNGMALHKPVYPATIKTRNIFNLLCMALYNMYEMNQVNERICGRSNHRLTYLTLN